MSKPASHLDLDALRDALVRVEGTCDIGARLAIDPVGIVRRFQRPEDIELVGLLASCLAFGNVKALHASIEGALDRLGPDLPAALDDPKAARRALRGFRHRMVQGDDIAGVLIGARRLQRAHGSLGAAFALRLKEAGGLREGLARWVADLRREGGLDAASGGTRRGPAHVLPDPNKASGCKRLLLYLRWMVRPDDGVDLGLWSSMVPASVLQIPVDTHVLRLARNLGMTRSAAASWRASEEITGVLRRIAPADPVRYDFALCHLGMARSCPSRRDEQHCSACAIRGACIHVRPGRRADRSRP